MWGSHVSNFFKLPVLFVVVFLFISLDVDPLGYKKCTFRFIFEDSGLSIIAQISSYVRKTTCFARSNASTRYVELVAKDVINQ